MRRLLLAAVAAAALSQPATAAAQAEPCPATVASCVDEAVTKAGDAVDLATYYADYYSRYALRQKDAVLYVASCAWRDCDPDYYVNMTCNMIWGEDCGDPLGRP